MNILIKADGSLTLEQHNDFKSFSIINETTDDNLIALDEIAESAEDNHYWLDAISVINLSPLCNNPEWVENFWAMLKAVEPYGYSDMASKRIKAHVESIS